LFRARFGRDFFLDAIQTRRRRDTVEPNLKPHAFLRCFDPTDELSHSAPHVVPTAGRVGPAYEHTPRVRALGFFNRVARRFAARRFRDAKRHPRHETRVQTKRRDFARGFRERANVSSGLTRERSPPLEGVLKRLPENPRRGAF
jgi:hypothetical protein